MIHIKEYVEKKEGLLTELVNDFNAFLAEIEENGKFAEIVAKYFENKGTKKGVEIARFQHLFVARPKGLEPPTFRTGI